MKAGFSVCIGSILFILLVPSIGLSVATLVIGSGSYSVECDDSDAVVSLSTWLITYGSTNIGIAVIYIISGFLLIFAEKSAAGILFTTLILSTCWNLAWSVIGGVSLFAGAMDCLENATAMGIMTVVTLGLQWLTMFLI